MTIRGIGRIIYDDPDNVGPIPLVTPGREGNFTWLYHNFKHYMVGRYYFPQFFISTGTAGAVSAGGSVPFLSRFRRLPPSRRSGST